MWGSPGVGVLHVFVTPLPDKGASHGAHHAQEEAEEEDDIDTDADTRRRGGLIARGLIAILDDLVYFNHECPDGSGEQGALREDSEK